jgi:hypothetical protein
MTKPIDAMTEQQFKMLLKKITDIDNKLTYIIDAMAEPEENEDEFIYDFDGDKHLANRDHDEL